MDLKVFWLNGGLPAVLAEVEKRLAHLESMHSQLDAGEPHAHMGEHPRDGEFLLSAEDYRTLKREIEFLNRLDVPSRTLVECQSIGRIRAILKSQG